MRTSHVLPIPVVLLCLLTACSTENSEPAVEGTIIDERTIVFDAGTNVGGPSSHTPDSDAVEAVVSTVDTHEDLTWARNHTRFIYGNEEPAGTSAARAFFACDQPPLTDPAQALDLFETASDIDGGGDCYGQAAIALDGTLLWSNTN